ncbi:PTS system cellobiose-specific IIC component [Streptococcus gallinaceus]|uniref:PTS sugar transporter subunit IIC n=1 Tax=Streptococcus gallinaceus TaxID=165758 RepID=UPI0020A10EF7|nr:PTS sugar transporter subunit IIC [Streptococcus gallinaceus]MCP1638772.1 PTS system cellobiose-specific IIC component [Streptococcus gallinaceus]MCP1769141.1 PTS system cellobiose-specific IIC component [Streptococcus gallinaceus]
MNDLLQKKLLPVAMRLGNNKFMIAIRDGITYSMPLIIIGSLFMIIASFPIPGWEKWLGDIGVAGYLWKGVDSSFGLVGLVSSFATTYTLVKQYKQDGIPAGIVSLSAFITVTPFITGEAGSGIPTSYMASKGLFIAIILGLLNGYIYQWFLNKDIRIRMPDGVPPAVSKSFSALIPGAVIITSWLILFGFLDKCGLPNVHDIAQVVLGGPLGLLGSNVLGLSVIVVLNSLFWFAGLHGGNIVNSVIKPVLLANLDANRTAYQAGEALPNIFTSVFVDNFVFIGGGGATIGLVIAMFYLARKKNASKQMKTLSPVTFLPGLFNINEPTMFGVPIVLNVLLLIPFVLAPIINLYIAWGAMASGLVPLTYTDPGWTMPPVISGLLATGSIKGAILQVLLIIIDVLLYLPFIMSIEKGFKKNEEG